MDYLNNVVPVCGNGAVEPGEQCDGSNLNGTTCQSLGFAGGTLSCRSNCIFNTSGCFNAPFCGNGIVQSGEECDDGVFNFGTFNPWNINTRYNCLSNCSLNRCFYNESERWITPNPTDLINVNCITAWGSKYKWIYNNSIQGKILNNMCAYCIFSSYSNSHKCDVFFYASPNERPEVIWSSVLSECKYYYGGTSSYMCDPDTPRFKPDARYTRYRNSACSDGVDNDKDGKVDMNDAGCSNPNDDTEVNPVNVSFYCGDNIVGIPNWLTSYNCNNQVEQCDGSNLNGKTCQDFGFFGGTLSCRSDCTFNTSGCFNAPFCGNGIVESGEQCDGSNLNGKTCQSLGFDDGTLSCRSDCTFNTSGCCLGQERLCNVNSDCCGFNIPNSSGLYCARFNSTLSYCCNKGSYATEQGCEVHISCSPVCVFNNNFLTNPG